MIVVCEELDSKKNKEFYSYLYRFIVLSVIIFISLCIILSGLVSSIIFLFIGYKEVIWTSDITLVEKVDLYSIIILNALYSLFINYYCLIIAKNKIENEFIFSQTILVSAYSILIDFFIYLIKLIFQQNVKNLYIFQMILSIIFLLPISLIILKYFFLFLLLSCSPKGSIKYNNGKFNCNICKDTGYVFESGKTSMCNCLKQKIYNIEFNQKNENIIKSQNFNAFNINLFSEEINEQKYSSNISPRENILDIKNAAINFINNFDDENTKNLIFSGGTGLRKNIYF